MNEYVIPVLPVTYNGTGTYKVLADSWVKAYERIPYDIIIDVVFIKGYFGWDGGLYYKGLIELIG